MKIMKIIPLICLLLLCFYQGKAQGKQKKKLVWAEEFDYQGLPDSTKWSYDKGTGCPNVCGWGNNELQFYTHNRQKNARVENGMLVLEAHQEDFEGNKYTSARIITKNKGDWKYAYVEVKAKLPQGTGTWPAIWMLPTEWKYGGWPSSGEIDIMEHVGFDPGKVHGTVHTKAYNHSIGTQKGKFLEITNPFEEFHVYAIDWSAEKIDFFIDGKLYNSFPNEKVNTDKWPFDQAFHLILNIAVGGNWGGQEGVDDSIWPQRMEVDYVRVYQSK